MTTVFCLLSLFLSGTNILVDARVTLVQCRGPGRWTQAMSKVYLLVEERAVYHKAQATCARHGAAVAWPRDFYEHETLQQLSGCLNSDAPVWAGLRRTERGLWQDAEGREAFWHVFGGPQWAPGHPGNFSCAVILPSREWIGTPCASSHSFICELDPAFKGSATCAYEADKGVSYVGTVVAAHNNVPCLSWHSVPDFGNINAVYPIPGNMRLLGHDNYCRNPDGRARPWCYTSAAPARTAECAVPTCTEPGEAVREKCPEETCAGRCLQRAEEDTQTCHCDSHCTLFNDCCPDLRETCGDLTQGQLPAPLSFECVTGNEFFGSSYWMVATCPDSWADSVIKSACVEAPPDHGNLDTVLSLVPVRDSMSDVATYRNVFCAICNNVPLSQVVFWDSGLYCRSANGSARTVNDISEARSDCPAVEVFYTPSDDVKYSPRMCFPQSEKSRANDSCSNDTCPSKAAFVHDKHNTYRNVDCAVCGGIPPAFAARNLSCGLSGPGRKWFEVCSPFCLPLTKLIALSTNQSVPGMDNETALCPPNSLYNPMTGICTALPDAVSTAAPQTLAAIKTTDVASTKPPKCQVGSIAFAPSEYTKHPNGRVFVKVANMSCPSYYVVPAGVTMYVCVDCFPDNDPWYKYREPTETTESSGDNVQEYLTLALICLSAISAVIFTIYSMGKKRLRPLDGKLKLQVVLSLVSAAVLFVVRVIILPGPVCIAFAIAIHLLLLVSFCTMSALAFDLYLHFSDSPLAANKKPWCFFLYSWGAPAVIVGITAFMDFSPGSSVEVGYGGAHCWIGDPMASVVAFGVPVALVLFTNACFAARILCSMCGCVGANNDGLKGIAAKAWFCVRMTVVMGLPWMLGFIVPFVHSPALEYVFVILNASHGFLLTVVFILNDRGLCKYEEISASPTSNNEKETVEEETAV
ncbi:ADGRL3 [Branchiostoma lanceolatum]|uniref:ADGRL3 protein n=1 Tax=Branchiostoma lanceolatum TaxID=7740 RepID=A0A8K0A342_BRALA|nr:ADGRL3 [Branchiostoma lanceolatum]